MECSTIEAYSAKSNQEIKGITAEEKKEMRKKMADMVGEEFMTQAIDDHLAKVSALREGDRIKFDRMVSGELKAGSEEFRKYAEEINGYLDKQAQDSGNHSDPRHNLVALMRCLESAQKEAAVKHAKESLIKEAEKGLAEIKKENQAVGDYLAEIVKKYMPKLRNCDFELIRDYKKVGSQYLDNFEEKLSSHLKMEIKGNNAPKTAEGKIALIKNHPRYHFYKAVCETKGCVPKKVADLVSL